MPRHFNVYLSIRWPTWRPRVIHGWSAGRLTYTAGFAFLWCAVALSLHFYEKDKPVNPYWREAA